MRLLFTPTPLLAFFLMLIGISCQSHKSEKSQASDASEGATSLAHHSIPFRLTSQNNISLPVILNHKDTLDLMLHTAMTEVSLTEEAAKQLFELGSQESITAQTWGGEGEAKYIRHNHLAIGRFEWDSLIVWVDKLSGPETDGKFGPNLFEEQIVEINFDKKELIIYDSLPPNLMQAGYQKFEVTYDRGVMYIAGTLKIGEQTYPNQFMVHSGYGSTILLDDQFASEHKLGAQLETISESELRDSYGNVLKTKKAILPQFLFGGHIFTDMPVSFFEGSLGRQKVSVLGGEILKRFNIVLDQQRSAIYLQENGGMEIAFELQ